MRIVDCNVAAEVLDRVSELLPGVRELAPYVCVSDRQFVSLELHFANISGLLMIIASNG